MKSKTSGLFSPKHNIRGEWLFDDIFFPSSSVPATHALLFLQTMGRDLLLDQFSESHSALEMKENKSLNRNLCIARVRIAS